MYQSYFGFQEAPFSIAPDPRYLFMSERHQEALAHLLYGVRGDGGFVLLTGEVGTGKTTVCRCLLEQLPEKTEVAFLFNPKLTVAELLATICDELRIDYPAGTASVKDFVDRLNARLLRSHAEGRRTVLIIDEAQNLAPEVLEQIRLLTNLETNQQKLLQIILLGQPELLDLLARPELRQLAQRITARYHLDALTPAETAAYVRHRLQVAGVDRQLFPPRVLKELHRYARGIPRLINLVCDRALLGVYVKERERVDPDILARAAREVLGPSRGGERFRRRAGFLTAAALGGLFVVAVAAFIWQEPVARTAPREPAPVTAPQVSDLSAAGGETRHLPEKPTEATLTPSWPEGIPRGQSEILAYQSLFEAWGLDYRPLEDGAPCDFARKQGLACLSGRASLRDLEHLDRPAVLTLLDHGSEPYFAALRGLTAAGAVLDVGGDLQVVQRSALEEIWRGAYVLAWRLPPAGFSFLQPGDEGPEVTWLASSLAEAGGGLPAPESTWKFDESLAARLQQFQLSAGLVPDGIVGPRTLIQLNSLIAPQEPRLSPAGGAREGH